MSFSALLDELGVPSDSTLRTHDHLWVLENASAMAGIGSGNFSLPPNSHSTNHHLWVGSSEDKLVLKMGEEEKKKIK